jgi:hypothetical protein
VVFLKEQGVESVLKAARSLALKAAISLAIKTKSGGG